ncbi:MAG: competence/damage-inducible protein A [Clostridiaceae bacterium]|nr:competence/damage-inducible protein A [Clostridiaceae bacterium]
MVAEILAVGTELLMGQIVNTNAQYLSRRLNDLGVNVYYHSVVGDNPKRLEASLKLALSRADVIITTGGLGPTQDDITKETIASALGLKLILNEEAHKVIRCFFEKRNRTMLKNNKKQAFLPEKSILIPNNNGTAPGCIIETDDKIIVMLPGPPKELIPMFEETVFPLFAQKTGQIIGSRLIKVFGVGESEMEMMISDILESQTNPTIAPYVEDGEIVIRVTARCHDKAEAEKMIIPVIDRIKTRLNDLIYSYDGETMEEVVVGLLRQKGASLSVAESCTGGMLSSKIINVPGSSEIFERGYVTYSNKAKVQELGVSEDILNSYGAVSSQTAVEMVKGLINKTGTRAGIAITGIAGPGGGTIEKPVGLVYIALYIDGNIECKELNLMGGRYRIRNMTCLNALNMLRKKLMELQ